MESDLHPLSHANIIFKCAVDTNLLAPENTDVPLSGEFSHIQTWAVNNGLLINLHKTNELVLLRPHSSKLNISSHLRVFIYFI